jgi:hypothetical protein
VVACARQSRRVAGARTPEIAVGQLCLLASSRRPTRAVARKKLLHLLPPNGHQCRHPFSWWLDQWPTKRVPERQVHRGQSWSGPIPWAPSCTSLGTRATAVAEAAAGRASGASCDTRPRARQAPSLRASATGRVLGNHNFPKTTKPKKLHVPCLSVH